MDLIVCKFGGTSVASPERLKNIAKRLVKMHQQGNKVVAVVSAMGRTTDELLGLAAAVNKTPPKRELDRLLSTGEQVSMSLLAMAIGDLGARSMSFTGRQAGIVTDNTHNRAKTGGCIHFFFSGSGTDGTNFCTSGEERSGLFFDDIIVDILIQTIM